MTIREDKICIPKCKIYLCLNFYVLIDFNMMYWWLQNKLGGILINYVLKAWKNITADVAKNIFKFRNL
jgi:hypothetical protein